jgi:hypothetical protein
MALKSSRGIRVCRGLCPRISLFMGTWDVDDYFDETGTEMPGDAKFQNLWLIGNSFTDFLSRCYISGNVSD